jgi:hypothetical protein
MSVANAEARERSCKRAIRWLLPNRAMSSCALISTSNATFLSFVCDAERNVSAMIGTL